MKDVIKKLVWALTCFGGSVVYTLALIMRIIGLMFELIGTAFRIAYEWLNNIGGQMLGSKTGKFQRKRRVIRGTNF